MTRSWLIIPLVTLAATGCNSSGSNESRAGGQATQNTAAKATPAEEQAARVSRRPDAAEALARLPGRWSRDADCGRIIEFRSDGTLVAFNGTPGTWSVDSGPEFAMLRMSGQGQVANMEVRLIADDEIQIRDTDPGTAGAVLTMQRCG